MPDLAQAFLGLSGEDILLLRAIESGMKDHEWVPSSLISQLSGLPAKKVDFLSGRLFERKLIERESLHYMGYRIDFPAYDLLSLHHFVEHNSLMAIGERIGVGKESVVYAAQGQNDAEIGGGDVPLAVKFHRQGRTSFKHIRRLRDHLSHRPRVPWLYAASLAAGREFSVMQRLYPAVSIPRPIARSRHALAMEYLEGPLLSRVSLEDPEAALDLILDQVTAALKLGIVHADLSEFNIIIAPSGPCFIDWPQAVETDRPHARELLERDLANVLRFFRRKYGLEMTLHRALQRMEGAEGI